MRKTIIPSQMRVGFSLKKEVFFVTFASIIGAAFMHTPRLIIGDGDFAQYRITLLIIARTLGSESYFVGFVIHIGVAIIIGIIIGVLLHKILKFNMSSFVHGIIYGSFSGIVVFAVFAIPVATLILMPNSIQVIQMINENNMFGSEHVTSISLISGIVDMFVMHIIWGLSLGTISSILTRAGGTNYRCHICDIEFSKESTCRKHISHIHENPSPHIKKILILGCGYGGIGVLQRVQKAFDVDVNVSITLVGEENFFLHTPLLPEMATGMIATRHIATPVRMFCKRARYYHAKVNWVDLENSRIGITRNLDGKGAELGYDHLVMAMGAKTNFFGNKNVEKYAHTIKTMNDAVKLRNHMIMSMERADQEDDPKMVLKMMTFVVVGGGFSGVETVGEINDFVRESLETYYRNIDPKRIRIILVSSGPLLPEIGGLGEYVTKSLKENGIEIITPSRLSDASDDEITLDDGQIIPYAILVWAGGLTASPVIADLKSEHAPNGKILVDEFLQIKGAKNAYALGDCAAIMDKKTGRPYPPTAQHAVREAKTVAENIISDLKGKRVKKKFSYKSMGSMAKIGKRNGVALLMGVKLYGFLAWIVWRQYYLSTLPSFEKRFRVAVDWTADLIFPRDITILGDAK
ncbi:MAG: Pyridine nucleotide-disulfide oxidoreductase [Cenarchaeum symbiont of Oopsacas minuta]|nr:Pyridine nucleotide-disulfide oxidoreductase [Cenarchaeum symbiont of Oopsacas minuta]